MGDDIAELGNDLYEVLGLEPGSDAKDVARAYKKKSLKHHPDRGGDVQKFLELKHARDVLLDPKKKDAYDKKLSRDAMKHKRQREEHAQRSQQRQRDINKLHRAEKEAEERRKRQKRGTEYSREDLNRFRDSTRARQQEFEDSAANQERPHSDARARESTPCTVTFKWDRRLFSHSDDTLIQSLREYGEIVSVKMKTSSAKVVFASKAAASMKVSPSRLVRALCAACFVLCMWTSAQAVQFDVRRRAEKCLSDEVAQGSLVVIHYNVIGAAKGKSGVSISITDPLRKYMKQDANIDTSADDIHKFSFHADAGGGYSVCFFNANENPVRVMLDFKHGVEAKDYTEVAKREHLMPVEKELRKMEDTVDEIHREMLYMREREAAMRSTNESTNSRVLWFSFFSIAVLLAMGVWQVMYLKRFFKSKKLI
ncbi:hypothetical protein ATCC90586_007698 [Pythium insidiosum]|nr:hypothetical protein ATCC90586_007698 [Pythium insidiosum]